MFTLTLIYMSFISSSFTNLSSSRLLFNLIEGRPIKEQFKLWHFTMGRPYDLNSQEGLNRYKIFKSNVKMIKETNNKNLGYTLGLGPFTDITLEEFKDNYLGRLPEDSRLKTIDNEEDEIEFNNLQDEPLRESVDWSSLYTDGAKDQQSCGACWAFAVIKSLEGMLRINNIKEYLSEQHLIDCEPVSNGCQGGFEDEAMNFVHKTGAIKQSDYPYDAPSKGGKNYVKNCRSSGKKTYVKIESFMTCRHYFTFNYCYNKFINDVIKRGPYAAAICVGADLAHYKDGPWLQKDCKSINHAVTVVHIKKDEIKILNSWGTRWGTNGFGVVKLHKVGVYRAYGLLDFVSQGYKPTVVGQ